MESMKKIVSCFMIDVNDYLTFCNDYKKPNFKYFNFVINKMGLLCIIESK